MYQALYRKWRPMTFDDVIGQEHVTRTLKNQLKSGRTAHAYLFTGTRGTGKTTCAKILARAVNCLNLKDGEPCNECDSCRGILSESILDVSEIDAATNNGVDNIRAIRDETSYTPANAAKRVYIIDEVHMLSTGAFNALLKTLEEPPEHVMFILATTEVHKLPATILSRCQRFDFRRIPQNVISGRLMSIAQAEKIGLTADGADVIAALGDGSMRDSLSLLERCALSGQTIDAQCVNSILGVAGSEYVYKLVDAAAACDFASAIAEFNRCYEGGAEINSLFSEMTMFLRDLLIIKLGGAQAAGLLNPKYDSKIAERAVAGMTAGRIASIIEKLSAGRERIRTCADKRLEAEMCLLSICTEDSAQANADRSAVGAEARQAPRGAENPGPQRTTPQAGVSAGATNTANGGKSAQTAAPERQQTASKNAEDSRDLPPWEQGAEAETDDPVNSAAQAPWEDKLPEKQELSAKNTAAPNTATPQKTEQPPANAAEFDGWGKLLAELKGKLSPPVYTHLSLCRASIEGRVITVHMEDDMTAMMIDRPDVKQKIEQAAAQTLGLQAAVKMSGAECERQNNGRQDGDALRDLLERAGQSGIKVDIK